MGRHQATGLGLIGHPEKRSTDEISYFRQMDFTSYLHFLLYVAAAMELRQYIHSGMV